MRGQWGREIKDVRLPELLTLLKKNNSPGKKRVPQQGPIFQYEAR